MARTIPADGFPLEGVAKNLPTASRGDMKTRCSHSDGLAHDCAYVEKRNKLIPLAEKEADEAAGPEPDPAKRGRGHEADKAAWNLRWSEAFHAAMARLCAPPPKKPNYEALFLA
jgi:hypothetical protein